MAALFGCTDPSSRETIGTVSLSLSHSVTPAADTFVNSLHPDNNIGASTSIFTGVDGQGGVMRGLIRFAMPAGLQGRATVTNVQLTLVTRALGNGAGGTVVSERLQAVLENWAQGNGVTDVPTMYVIGQTCSAAVSGATWRQPNCVSGTGVLWSSPGGTVASVVSGQASTTSAVDTPVTWNSAAAGNGGMNTDVQNWIDSPNTNFGWRITSSDEVTLASAQRFYAMEAGGASVPSLTITYDCKAGFRDTGSDCTSCTAAANADCVTSQGNVCVDVGAPASYSCTCSNPAYVLGTGTDHSPACVDKDDCIANPCRGSGDSAALCVDHVAPQTGYDCTCSAGFTFNGTACVNSCGSGTDPCGSGGTCSISGSSWSCACTAGYVSTGGTHPICVNLDACDAAANTSCAAANVGNSCIDEIPPSTAYHCGCDNAAYTAGTIAGKSACVDKNECSPNHCTEGGDFSATCSDNAAPAVGYVCACAAGWTFNGVTCSSSGSGGSGGSEGTGGGAGVGGLTSGAGTSALGGETSEGAGSGSGGSMNVAGSTGGTNVGGTTNVAGSTGGTNVGGTTNVAGSTGGTNVGGGTAGSMTVIGGATTAGGSVARVGGPSTGGTNAAASDLGGGCSCRVGPNDSNSLQSALAIAAALGAGLGRARRRVRCRGRD